MRYRRNWNGMTEIFPIDGNKAQTHQKARDEPKVIHVDCFAPKAGNGPRERYRAAERYRREKEVELIRLAIQAVMVLLMFVMICMLDAADMIETVILMAGIIGCVGVMILLEIRNEH